MNSTASLKGDLRKFKAQKNTVFKKATELSALCGVDVALIMYHHGVSKPDVWCSRPGSIHTLLGKYLPGNNQRVTVKDDSKYIDSLTVDELTNFDGVLAEKIDKVNERINLMSRKNHEEDGRASQYADNENCRDDFDVDVPYDCSDQGTKFSETELVINEEIEDDFRLINELLTVNENDQIC